MNGSSLTRRGFLQQVVAGGVASASMVSRDAAADPAAVTHRTITTNGIRMHIAEQGQGPLVLLCHGFPESWYSWRHQLPALAGAGFHAVAPDMRGYGQTERPAEIDKYTLLHLVGDMTGVLDALGEASAVVVGHDWGAAVAWQCALLRPDRFRAVAALSVPYRGRGPVPPTTTMPQTERAVFYMLYFQTPGRAEAEFERDVRDTMRRVLVGGSGDAPPRDPAAPPPGMVPRSGGLISQRPAPATLPAWLTEADIDYYTAEFSRTGFRGGLNWYRNIDRNIAGDRDGVVAVGGGPDRVVANLKTSVPQLRNAMVLPGCGHWTQQERPKEVNAALIDFLKAL